MMRQANKKDLSFYCIGRNGKKSFWSTFLPIFISLFFSLEALHDSPAMEMSSRWLRLCNKRNVMREQWNVKVLYFFLHMELWVIEENDDYSTTKQQQQSSLARRQSWMARERRKFSFHVFYYVMTWHMTLPGWIKILLQCVFGCSICYGWAQVPWRMI